MPLPDTDVMGPEAAQPGRRLSELAEKAVLCSRDCCGAGTTVSGVRGDDRATAVTHPDLASVVAVQLRSGDGPIPAALDSGLPVDAEDLLSDERWPAYRAIALETGVRSSVTLPFTRGDLAVTLSLFSFRPGALRDVGHGPVRVLGDFAASCLVRDRHYRAALAEVDQLETALRSRPVVDQACGILMHLCGCDADEAFGILRRISQGTNRKLHEVAAGVVHSRGRGVERDFAALKAS
ncbi:ANTAR domain-containing response regulator [Streptomyces sp. GC420]|uniref:ANTAR domain-containing response regulator n=1 Tax=Streptomyces sp. GC420 TaxID=2697568 RepID=UPI001414E5A2|nr:ANTAR domain-containing protein [Streptomyces sp. GC420]NBM18859.1 ANTAR domain-containing protein [Streptomyces sp. GC420]